MVHHRNAIGRKTRHRGGDKVHDRSHLRLTKHAAGCKLQENRRGGRSAVADEDRLFGQGEMDAGRFHAGDFGAASRKLAFLALLQSRSEERRGGKECVSTWRSRWAADHKKKKKKI